MATPERSRLQNSSTTNTNSFQMLSSPMKVPLSINTKDTSPRDNTQEFCQLSLKLTSLLDKLTNIYREIGYSKDEIQKNEKSLFESIFLNFDKFLDDSITYREALKAENLRTIEVLRSLLRIINDPNGTRSIPDLYLRNLILKSNMEGSTLLNLRKSLESCKDFVLRDYKERMQKFLNHCIKLDAISSKLEDFEPNTRCSIPDMSQIAEIMSDFEAAKDPVDIYPILSGKMETLLDNTAFNDLSDTRYLKLSQLLNEYNQEVKSRTVKLSQLSKNIIDLWTDLEIDYETDYSMISETVLQYTKQELGNFLDLDISSSMISELTRLHEELSTMKNERVEQLNDYISKCELLWEKLKQDPAQTQKFRTENSSLSLKCIENYMEEYTRLLGLKQQYIKDFILDARDRVEELWDLLCYSDSQRDIFQKFYSEDFNDELLNAHEEEIEKLTAKYEAVKPLMENVQKFKNLLKDKEELEESQKDSSRLLQRNSHKILMEEEKTRKRIIRQMPKLVAELRKGLDELESSGEDPLSFLGDQIIYELDEQQKILESKGRRIGSGASAAPSRAPSRQPSRAPSRQPSRASSRVASPVKSKQIIGDLPSSSLSSIPRFSVNGVQKPSSTFRKPLLKSSDPPRLTASSSCELPSLRSPVKATSLTMATSSKRIPLKTPTRLTRSHSSFQPQLSKLPELSATNNPRQRSTNIGSPLKSSNRFNNVGTPKSRPTDKIITSPLKSLRKGISPEEDKENGGTDLTFSDDENGGNSYSSWRQEQLRKLNSVADEPMDLNMDNFR